MYNKIKEDYSNHPNIEYVNERLSSIKADVDMLIKENSFNLRFNDALSLLKAYQLDSARTVLESIVVSRKSSSYQTVNSLIMQIDLYDNLKEGYANSQSDSLIYEMGKIEYFYFYNDLDSEDKMKKILNNFPESRYKDQAAWLLNKKFGNNSYFSDNLDYSLIDTTMIRLKSPVDDLDVKEIRQDSIKLDDILLYLENDK